MHLEGVELDAIQPPAPLLEAVRRLALLADVCRDSYCGLPATYCADSTKFDPEELLGHILDDLYMDEWLREASDYFRKWFFAPTRSERDEV